MLCSSLKTALLMTLQIYSFDFAGRVSSNAPLFTDLFNLLSIINMYIPLDYGELPKFRQLVYKKPSNLQVYEHR